MGKLKHLLAGFLALSLVIAVNAQDVVDPSSSDDITTTLTSRRTQFVTATAWDNLTTTSHTATATDQPCCFILQDTATEVWAELFSPSTWWQIVNITSLTVRVTPISDTITTNIETNIHTTNATFSTSIPVGKNPIPLFDNDAPGVAQTTTLYADQESNKEIVLGGVTVTSPQAAYVYTSLKIITVAAVTNSAGEVVCGTDYTFPTVSVHYYGGESATTVTIPKPTGTSYADATYSNINSNAQAYYGGYSILGAYNPLGRGPGETMDFFNSQLESVDVNIPRTGLTLTFDTFVYQPASGATGTIYEGRTYGHYSTGTEGYGYPPQTLLDSLIANPAIASQYPGLESCLPAGPSIIHPSLFEAVAPVFQLDGGDLTDAVTITVTPDLPTITAQPITKEPIPTPTPTPTSSALPIETNPPVVVPPTSREVPPVDSPTSPPADIPIPTVAPPVATTAPQPPVDNSPPADDPSPPSAPETTAQQAPGDSPPVQNPATNQAPPNPSPISTDAAIASGIASIIGASPLSPGEIGGTPVVIVSAATTVPFDPAAPVDGITVIVDGTTNVIISSATTVPISEILDDLPGSAVTVSGNLGVGFSGPTTVPVDPQLPGLQGSSIVSGGTTYVVVTGPTTVPVVLGAPSGGNGSAPIQVTSAGPGSAKVGGAMMFLSMLVLVCL